MAIQSILSQPLEDSINAAYRPVSIRVSATANFGGGFVPPVVYCDIYFDDVFYKTLSKTQYTELGGSNSEWEFDIQDAAQEYLQKQLPAIAQSSIVEVTTIIAATFCRIRCSGINSEGFIESDGTAPVQGTSSSDPVSGTGEETNTFYIVNATLQHTDNQTLTEHLAAFKTRTWAADVFPLTHRLDGYGLGPEDSDIFPIIETGDQQIAQIRLNYRNCDQSVFGQATIGSGSTPSCTAIISDPVAILNGLGWYVSWSVIFGSPGKYHVSTPTLNGGAPYETTNPFLQLSTLAVGEHVITVRPLCLISGEYYFGAAKTVTVNVAACEGVGLEGSTTLPTAITGIAYFEVYEITGTLPYVLSAITKPSWMTVALVGGTIQFSGTPTGGDIATDVEVSFTLENDCGDFIFDGTIDVEAAVAIGSFQIANSAAGVSIVNVTPAFFALTTGSFPFANGQSGDGTSSAYTGIVGVGITKVGGPTAYMRLYVDAVQIDCLAVTGSGSYLFTSTTINSDSDVEILVNTTPC